MKTLFITSNAKTHQSNIFGNTEIYEFKNLNDSCSFIRKNDIDVILIVAEDKFEGGSNEWGGLELLILLRTENIRIHLVVFSFYCLKSILERTHLSGVLSTSCVSFFQLPFYCNLSQFYDSVKHKKSEFNELTQKYSSIVNPIAFRHEFGNIWGLNILIEAYNLIYELEKDQKIRKRDSLSITNQLNYRIGKFLNSKRDFDPDKQTKDKTKSHIKALKSINNKKILYIDDKANEGWLEFLKLFFDESVLFYTLTFDKNTTKESLLEEVLNLSDAHKFDCIISDLRLFNAENNESNYKKFTGFYLISKIYNYKEDGNLIFKDIPFMYFSASNNTYQLFRLINAIDKKPSAVYVKQNFDIQVNPNQKFENLLSLVISFRELLDDNYKRRQITSMWDEELNLEDEIKKFKQKLLSQDWLYKITTLQNKLEKENFDAIFIDTNIYLLEEPIPALMGLPNIKVTYPVYKELQRIANKNEHDHRVINARYFVENLNLEDLYKEGLNEDELKKLDRLFAIDSGLTDKVDDCLMQMAIHLASQGKKVLFYSNDVKDKNGKLSPVNALKKYKEENKDVKIEVRSFY